MQAYTELVVPSAVSHSLALSLTSTSAENLVVAKGSLLQIFTTKEIPTEADISEESSVKPRYEPRVNDDDGLESSFLGGEASIVRTDRSQCTKLVLVAEIPLAGTVIGLARIKLSKSSSGGEGLLIAYKAAKLALTEWDPQQQTLETLSLHYYEKDDLSTAPWELPLGDYVNYLASDPGSRCAAFKFGSRNLAILPFRQSSEDLEMDDWDEDLDGPRPEKKEDKQAVANGDSANDDPAYTPSFVLRLPLLDPSLLHPVHLSFLYEYREPTIGILSGSKPPSAALGLKDYLTYKVFTLDLQQKASTTILSVTDLPRDLWKVIALPPPIGGALLVGENELIHVDQSGKPNGVAVNPMTKDVTNFNMSDQSDLGLRLEGCSIEVLSIEHGELLIILNDGRFALLTFKIDGRTVSGISIKKIAKESGGDIVKFAASTVTKLHKNSLFVGSEGNDSIVLGWTRKHAQEKRRKPRLVEDLEVDVDDLDLEDDEEDDDLYGNDSSAAKPQANGHAKSGELTFRISDSLLSLGPILDVTCGKPTFVPDSEEATLSKGVSSNLELACAVGKGRAGSIAVIHREIQPKVIGRFDFPEARGFWTMCVSKPVDKNPVNAAAAAADTTARYDRFMIVAKVDLDGYETSDVYALTAAGFESIKDTEFEPAAGFTVEAGVMGKRSRIIQVLKSEVRSYDGNLGLTQILPMLDEETGAEPRVLSASIADPYLLLIRDDGSAWVASMDKNNEMEEMEKPEGTLASTKWASGCLYTDRTSIFQESAEKGSEKVMMFLLSAAGALHVYALPDLTNPVYTTAGLTYIPPVLSADWTVRRGMPRESFSEIVVADLGDRVSRKPYLIARHSSDDLTIYEPFRHQSPSETSLAATLHFKKSSNPVFARVPPKIAADDEDTSQAARFVPLRTCANVHGYSTVFLPGPSPSFLIKSSKSIPHVIGLQGQGVRGMSPFHTEGCERGFIYADSSGVARVTELPSKTDFAQLGVSVKKIPLDVEVRHLAYHRPSESYVAGCLIHEPFELPRDDDYHKEWARETVTFAPTVARGVVKLINPTTWTCINNYDLEECETIEAMKALHLEVSEDTRERKMLIAVGSSLSKGEDLPTKGRVQVLDIVSVIPEPGRPETNRRLKPIAKEDIPRGGVTALSEIGTQGLMLIAQGQKCMVRGLKEDGSLLPVAFLDMNCHVASAKSLPRTGLCLLADAFKGVWFAGYTEEPYTFKVLGKSGSRVPILVADFLPQGDDLSIIAVDADGDLHVLEFNPEHPKSLQGNLLLHKATFSVTPNTPTNSMLLPYTATHSSPSIPSADLPPHILLMTSPSGQIATMVPLAETPHRRLLSLTNQLLSTLPSTVGLNSKAYRHAQGKTNVGVDSQAGRSAAVVDASVLARWSDLGSGKRSEVVTKGGYDGVSETRDELRGVLAWTGLAYL
ncbi:CPSF A subunit region-domain-containing protein [Emericellopsis atlantica]|uniref:CPSF A subunit region-domain-containing protein n=1 Tax=Emericellopsis atlantica TaxID=2614577 RepID=A0A9P7ZMG0_9HYPO|nr:CPSF A subunit region-domain-containing protein [Emericellopsis atlantica]KAG9254809.1 CPSF A subunit region-domain-containing protein [Emericellopsis atlantica]